MSKCEALLLITFFSMNAFGAFGLNTFSNEYKPKTETQLQVTNMPKVRSQDSIGICYSFVASTLIDEANCVANKVQDCSSVPNTNKASPLDMARYSQDLPEDTDSSDRFNYEGLNEGGSAAFAIYNAGFRAQAIVRESCAPFDQVVSKITDPAKAQKSELEMWQKFKNMYEAYKRKQKECAQCALEYATTTANDIKKDFNLKASNQEILKAFAEDSYSKFLDKILIPDDCWDFKNQISLKGNWKMNAYPDKNQTSNYQQTISKIKEVLGRKRPISIGFCTQTPLEVKSTDACGKIMKNGEPSGEGHAVVIKGYRRVCNSKNQCYDALQIQNSWGESWQSSNDDGWVDAKELLDRTFYESGSLAWLDPKS
ncbi:hypothetical protein [Bdellovibrio sp. BCCA]|uniref:hypothetical protein n=1 Tax=Bdellovibrio sp. BCCA TaxID=3136281 RepID=UPI0030F0E571